MDRSPLHMLSFVIAFVPLRLVAAANNLLIYYYGTAPLGRLIGLLSHRTSLVVAFWLVMGTLFYVLTFACSPLAARVMRWLRTREDTPNQAMQRTAGRSDV
jgi:membrane protein implicated in regulation of membrane protease activity